MSPTSRSEQLPVVIGVAESVRRPGAAGIPDEPRAAIADVVRRAAGGDSRILSAVAGIHLSNTASWTYSHLARGVAADVGATPALCFDAPIGGQWPTRLLDTAALRIATGQSRVEVVAGGEMQASMTAALKGGIDVAAQWGWSRAPGGLPNLDPEQLGARAMRSAGLVAPTRVYPVLESANRAARGQTVAESDAWSAQMYAGMSAVARRNPLSWLPADRSAESILDVGPGNRMVCEPYRLTMNAMPHVDQAAALVLTSLGAAREFGVPDDSIVYVWGGSGARDDPDFLARRSLAESPALERSVSATLYAAQIDASVLDIVDVYSCFPVVPKMLLDVAGLPPSFVPTVTGGHSFFGGPLNSYSVHALAAVYRRLVAEGGGDVALVHANGGHMTYQHCTLLGRHPHPAGFVGRPDPVDVRAARPVPVASVVDSTVTVEAATVSYGRNGLPEQAFVVGRTDTGQRVAVQSAPGDSACAAVVSIYPPGEPSREVVGRRVHVRGDGGHALITDLATDAPDGNSP